MRKQWSVAAAVLTVFFSVFGAAAQAPQGAGAEKAPKSSDAPHSYNPINWVKKSPNTPTEKPKKAKNKKSTGKSASPDSQATPPKV
jgi:hypothetical protein